MSEDKRELTGGSVSYYSVAVDSPTTPERQPYVAECNDIIESLNMSFAEGNILKALWRVCAARQGVSKKGYDDLQYDIDKIRFFADRLKP